MTKVTKVRPHHFNTLLLIWYPKNSCGGNPIRGINKEYSREHGKYWRKIANEIRKSDDVIVEPVPSIDSLCENCKATADQYKPACEREDTNYRNELRLFREMGLEYGKQYVGKDIAERIDCWVQEHPMLPLWE
ncbi:DUF1284 domain-containing protein [Candidatus Woesearchaeota archaeon]|nr:DUF1284 domain-containing protein [Candidatus Woesearchaeota archaeon]